MLLKCLLAENCYFIFYLKKSVHIIIIITVSRMLFEFPRRSATENTLICYQAK